MFTLRCFFIYTDFDRGRDERYERYAGRFETREEAVKALVERGWTKSRNSTKETPLYLFREGKRRRGEPDAWASVIPDPCESLDILPHK